MGSSEERVVAVIMVGGPTKGNFFSFSLFLKFSFLLDDNIHILKHFCVI